MEDKTWIIGEYIETPFKVRQMITHCGRYFAIDEDGRLQWSRGDSITRWFRKEEQEGELTNNSAGWWSLSGEKMVSLKSVLMGLEITTESGAKYVLTGNSPLDFALLRVA